MCNSVAWGKARHSMKANYVLQIWDTEEELAVFLTSCCTENFSWNYSFGKMMSSPVGHVIYSSLLLVPCLKGDGNRVACCGTLVPWVIVIFLEFFSLFCFLDLASRQLLRNWMFYYFVLVLMKIWDVICPPILGMTHIQKKRKKKGHKGHQIQSQLHHNNSAVHSV